MKLLSCARIQIAVYVPTMHVYTPIFNRCIEKTCSQIPIMLLESISASYLHYLHVQPTHSPNPLLKCSLLCIITLILQNKRHILSRLQTHRSFCCTPLQTPAFRPLIINPKQALRTSVLPNQPLPSCSLFQQEEELKAQNFKFKHQSHLGELDRGELVSVDAAYEKIAVFF